MSERDHVIDSTAAYALGALDAADARAFEEHCAQCAQCAEDLTQMRAIASALPLACEPHSPPLGLKRRVVAAVRADLAAGQIARGSSTRSYRSIGGGWWAAAAAAIFISGAALGGKALLDHRLMESRLASVTTQLAGERARSAAMAVDASANRDLIAAMAAGKVWDVSSGSPQHWWHCTIVQPPHHRPAMLLALAPPAPRGMTYQGWVIHHGRAHSIGTVAAGKTSMVHMPMPLAAGDVVAFTMEPMGGSVTPTMPFVVARTLD